MMKQDEMSTQELDEGKYYHIFGSSDSDSENDFEGF